MESLVLVLLYCSLYWLEYKIKMGVARATTIEFFEGYGCKQEATEGEDGMYYFLDEVGFKDGDVRPI